jgi:hypothetical protein
MGIEEKLPRRRVEREFAVLTFAVPLAGRLSAGIDSPMSIQQTLHRLLMEKPCDERAK